MSYVHDEVLDGGLDFLIANANRIVYCIGDPVASFTEANTASGTGSNKRAGYIDLVSTDFTGPINGTGGGRSAQLNAKTGTQNGDVDSAANAVTHFALLQTGSSRVLVSGPLQSATTVSKNQVIEIDQNVEVLRFPDAV